MLHLLHPLRTVQAHVGAVQGRLAELSTAGLALECSQWLDQLSQQLRQLGGGLLGPCSSGQGLLGVEAAVRAALDQWQYSLQAPAAGEAADGEPPAAAMSWSDVCLWVLGRACPLWPLLFEQPLLERAKQLVAGDFSSLVDEVAGLLGSALKVGVLPTALGRAALLWLAWCLHSAGLRASRAAACGTAQEARLTSCKRRGLFPHVLF